jgi:hypothetical protein
VLNKTGALVVLVYCNTVAEEVESAAFDGVLTVMQRNQLCRRGLQL